MSRRKRQKQEAFKLQRGWQRGWSEYRHGTRKPITLHQLKPAPISSGERRKHFIAAAMDILRDWRLSPFEHEARARSGLRSGLCLQGYGFERSEAEAAEVVAEGLRLLGAVRPSWEQGQREYVEPRENCAWCGRPKDQYQLTRRFCSPHCARMALLTRDYEGAADENLVRVRTLKLAGSLKSKKRTCLQCRVAFYPETEASPAKFCTRTCFYAYRHKEEAATVERDCVVCGTAFRGKNVMAMYCSAVCNNTAQRRKRGVQPKGQVFPRLCECCGSSFKAMSADARFCSQDCVRLASRMRTGKQVPKRVTPLVLDYIFCRQGLRITGERMAA